ncbi:MAG: cupin domain-containing protein [Desulfobacterota bacterium]|nr:cupin domain-containing protein [Thermodesulfobacteriota bacterium]
MLIRDVEHCKEIAAGDGCRLRELLHPEKTNLKIGYSLAHACVEPGRATLPHRLKTTEVYYILEGQGIMHINEEHSSVKAGAAVYIPPGAVQWIENTGDNALLFLCIVEPAWRLEDEEILA